MKIARIPSENSNPCTRLPPVQNVFTGMTPQNTGHLKNGRAYMKRSHTTMGAKNSTLVAWVFPGRSHVKPRIDAKARSELPCLSIDHHAAADA
jgi:hypothetical protein